MPLLSSIQSFASRVGIRAAERIYGWRAEEAIDQAVPSS